MAQRGKKKKKKARISELPRIREKVVGEISRKYGKTRNKGRKK